MVLEAFVDLSLEDTLKFLSTEAPEVSMIEVGAGGYAPNPHCDVDDLLVSEQSRRQWLCASRALRHWSRCTQRVGQPCASRP